ncbi:uncharacterized protein [Onthophagus taurus]|uniref:uncharacterized protein n=1 Tax=Onthophagus taurus TaxID=166361 RepID=UPI0039BE8982
MATASEIDLNPIFERQNDIHGLISRTIDNIKKLAIAKRTRGNIQSRLERLEANWSEFNESHKYLSKYRHLFTETIYFTDDLFSVCEEAYMEAKGEILDLMESFLIPQPSQAPAGSVTEMVRPSAPSRHLPQIKLPNFDGKYANWAQFRDLFVAMVTDNRELSDVERLQYLKMTLIGEPAQLLKNIAITNENFKRAWQTLVERYENRRLLIESQLAILFSARAMKNESSSELKRLVGEVKEAIGALEVLKCPVQHWDYFLVFLIIRKLDMDVMKEWEKSIGDHRDPSTYEELENFLIGRIHTLEAIENLQANRKPNQTSHSTKIPVVKVHNASSGTSNCFICTSNHYISSCPTYLAKSPSARIEFVKSNKRCFNCLGPHLVKDCRVSKRCRVCNKNHHSTLHDAPSDSRSRSTSTQHANPETNVQQLSSRTNNNQAPLSSNSHVINSHHVHTPVILATALVLTVSSRGETILVRALIDQGSEVSFISESLVQQLQISRHSASIPIFGIGSQHTSVSRGTVNIKLTSKVNPFISYEEEALILPKLTAYLPQKRTAHIPFELADLPLADPDFTSSRNIDLILGVTFYSKIIQDGIRRSEDGSLVAQQTSLGWILSGIMADQPSSNSNPFAFQCSIDRELLEIIQRFWQQEDDTVSVPCISPDEKECEDHFVSNYSRDLNGRFVVRLPFRRSPTELGASYPIAIQTFTRLELRFAKNLNFKQKYNQFMCEYLELDHMRQVSAPLRELPQFYLPHHGVIRESSSTTKLRVVFNGSQKTSSGISLNECLHTGPKLQTELVDVLLRWRRHPVVFACDLEKMYRQIKVHPDDWRYQQIVWRENCTDPIQTYQLTTVTYGLSCAPYLAIRCLRQLADEHLSSQPLRASVIRLDTYVDDILSGANDLDKVQEVIFQVNLILTAGGFTARKWTSNHPEVLRSLAPEFLSGSSTVKLDESNSPRALGLLWNNSEDNFLFSFKSYTDKPFELTKRVILSFIARLFDPLGWLAPIVVTAKIFMQELWTRNLEWDDSLPSDLVTRWSFFLDNFKEVPTIRVPRWLGLSDCAQSVEVHGFADASNSAYGAVVYLRVVSGDEVRVSILIAKTKVSPIKRVTIPRLELCAAVILTRLIRRVRVTLDLINHPVHLWSDSTVALFWICSHPSRWKDYVRNRVTEIQELTEAKWHHLPSEDTPADLLSRGVPLRRLQQEDFWWSGPSWLRSSSSQWPLFRTTLSTEADVEQRAISTSNTASMVKKGWDLKEKYSSLSKLLRVTAWCIRVFDRNKLYSVSDILSPEEINRSLMFWVRECQQLYFGQEIRLLQSGKAVQRSSPLFRLVPFVDGLGFLRITGRLRFSTLDWDEKHPIILPRDSRLTTLIIDSHHRRTLHGGTQLTSTSIRRQFWIIGGRVPVRAFIHRCMICAKQRAVTGQQLMGQLPSARVRPSKPFQHSGIDYAGPFQLRSMLQYCEE